MLIRKSNKYIPKQGNKKGDDDGNLLRFTDLFFGIQIHEKGGSLIYPNEVETF